MQQSEQLIPINAIHFKKEKFNGTKCEKLATEKLMWNINSVNLWGTNLLFQRNKYYLQSNKS